MTGKGFGLSKWGQKARGYWERAEFGTGCWPSVISATGKEPVLNLLDRTNEGFCWKQCGLRIKGSAPASSIYYKRQYLSIFGSFVGSSKLFTSMTTPSC